MTDIRYPAIEVALSEGDGNAFVIIGTVMKALRKGGVSAAEIEVFRDEAMEADYDHVLQTCMKWVTVC